MQIKFGKLFILIVLSAFALGFSYPFTGGLFPLAFVAFVPLLIFNFQLDREEFEIGWAKRFFLRFGVNYLYFVIYNVITTWWIYYASEAGAYMAFLANSILMTLPFFFTGFCRRILGEWKGLLAFFVMWMSFEHLHFYWELSWPWLNLGHVLGTQPYLIQWYEYSGVMGGTMWILLVNIFIYVLIRNLYFRKESRTIQFPLFLLLGATVLIPIISSLIIYGTYEEKEDPVNIVVVQPNIDSNHEKFVWPAKMQLDILFEEATPLLDDNVDLIVCPETAITESLNEGNLEIQNPIVYIKNFLAQHNNVPMLIGGDSHAYYDEPASSASIPYKDQWYENYNTAFMIDPTQPTQTYRKAKLVMGGERIPFIDYFSFLKDYSVSLGGSSGMLGAGSEVKNFSASGLNFAPLICYESVYGDYASYFTRKGADILCVITNDGWWRDTPGYKQHRAFSQIRAIENRRSMARSANTGISCFIDQRGDIISELLWDERGAIKANLNRNTEFTFFVKYGDIIGRLSIFITLAMLLYSITVMVKRGTNPGFGK